MTSISIGYIVAGLTFQTVQTTLTALAWYYILVAGYPNGGVRYRDILAAYATGVAMNGFLPANIGTFVVAAHVRRPDPRLDLLRRPRRDGGAEDLLHGDRGRSSTSTSSSRCRGRTTSSSAASPTGFWLFAADRRRRRSCSCTSSIKRFWSEAQGPLGPGEARRRDPREAARLRRSRCCCRRSAHGSRSSA